MKRSEINGILKENIEFIKSQNFSLPPFAWFTPDEWKGKGHEYDENPGQKQHHQQKACDSFCHMIFLSLRLRIQLPQASAHLHRQNIPVVNCPIRILRLWVLGLRILPLPV